MREKKKKKGDQEGSSAVGLKYIKNLSQQHNAFENWLQRQQA